MLIGFGGKKRSGKDTCGNYLIKNYGFVRYSFGDPVKEVARVMFCLTDEQLYGNLKEVVDPRWNLTPRDILQKIGTDLGQFGLHDLFPNINCVSRTFWLKHFQIWYEKNKHRNVVVTDVRFAHEKDMIESLGGIVIHVIRPELNSGDNHISEVELDEHVFKHTITNDQTIEDLNKDVEKIYSNLVFDYLITH